LSKKNRGITAKSRAAKIRIEQQRLAAQLGLSVAPQNGPGDQGAQQQQQVEEGPAAASGADMVTAAGSEVNAQNAGWLAVAAQITSRVSGL